MENTEKEKRFVILGKASNGGGGGGEGTVTSVGISVPTGMSVTGSPVTSSGTIHIGFANGYSIPTTTKQAEWDAKSDFSGDYNDLTNKPTIPSAQVNSDWNASSGVAQILNKPTLATVATSGSYNDLTDKPTIPTKTSDLTNDSGFVVGSNLATVATSGSYNDLSNKPTIPTVGNGTITITQGGTTKGTFTLNQSGNSTIALDAGGSGDVTADGDNTFTGDNTFAGNNTFTDTTIDNIVLGESGSSINGYSAYFYNSDAESTLMGGNLSMAVNGGSASLSLNVSVETDENDEPIPVADITASMTKLRINAGSVEINGYDALTTNDVATVATSGSYNDLTNRPTIPAAQVNSDWNASSGVAQILNKPSMSTETLTFIDDNNVSTTVVVYTQPTV